MGTPLPNSIITRTAVLNRVPIGERIRIGDFWEAQWGWTQFTEQNIPFTFWGLRQKVTKFHLPIYRVTDLRD